MITQIIRQITQITIFTIALALTTSLFAVEVEPHRFELSLPAGETSVVIIKLTNWQDYTVKINMAPDYYRHILTENATPPRGETNKLASCENWIKLEPNEFELGPKGSIQVKCIINVPAGAKKEHVASILVDEKGLVTTYEESISKPGNITLELIPRFTIPLYITPKGTETVSAEIEDMKITEGPVLGTLKAEIILHNNGTVHIRPSGNLVFVDSEGELTETIPIGEGLPVFPDYKEKIPVYYPGMLEPGAYAAICTINIGEGKLLQRKIHFRVTEDYDLE